jgi:hypothetical protein
MTKDEYCLNVCGGKCCKWWTDKKEVFHICPHLDCSTNKCRAHDRWRDNACNEIYTAFVGKEAYEVETMSIQTMIEEDLLPEWIKEKCCYYNEGVLHGQNKDT